MRRVPAACSSTRPASLRTFRCCDTAGRLTGQRVRELADGVRPFGEAQHDGPTAAVTDRCPNLVAFVRRHER